MYMYKAEHLNTRVLYELGPENNKFTTLFISVIGLPFSSVVHVYRHFLLSK